MYVGIIGCGGVSRFHIDSYMAYTPHFALADIDNHKSLAMQHYCHSLGAEASVIAPEHIYDEDIDALSICLAPCDDKSRIIIEGISKRKNMLIEKPLAQNMVDAQEIISYKQDSTIAICYNWRFNELINNIRDEYPKLESLTMTHIEPWNYTEPGSFYTNIGYLQEHNIHDINLLAYLSGIIRPIKAHAYGHLKNPSSISIEFVGIDGSEVVWHSMNGTARHTLYIHGRCQDKGFFGLHEDSKHVLTTSKGCFRGPSNVGHQAIINDFLDSIADKRLPRSTLMDAYNDHLTLENIARLID